MYASHHSPTLIISDNIVYSFVGGNKGPFANTTTTGGMAAQVAMASDGMTFS